MDCTIATTYVIHNSFQWSIWRLRKSIQIINSQLSFTCSRLNVYNIHHWHVKCCEDNSACELLLTAIWLDKNKAFLPLKLRFWKWGPIKKRPMLLEMCYFNNVSIILQTVLAPSCKAWFDMNYCLAMGPVSLSFVAYQFKTVPHNLDIMISYVIHITPPIMVNSIRWGVIKTPLHFEPDTSLPWISTFVHFPLFMVGWTVVYNFVTGKV